MEPFLTPGNITFGLTVLGVIFAIYIYFRDPQQALEKRQALDQKDIDGKTAMLELRMKLEKEATEERFKDFSSRLDSALTLAQNHIHTVDTKVDSLIGTVGTMSNQITRLATIIDERIPKT